MSDIAIGLCDHHEGWAAAVALSGPGEALRVLDRRRLTLCGNGLPARVYHRVTSSSPAAQQLIDTVREHAADAASEQLAAMIAALGAAGHRVRAAAVAISAV